MASATASLPVTAMVLMSMAIVLLLLVDQHLDGFGRALLGADATAFAMREVHGHRSVVLDDDRGVRAVEVAEHAAVALFDLDDGHHGAPATGLVHDRVARVRDGGAQLVPVGTPGIHVADVPAGLGRGLV